MADEQSNDTGNPQVKLRIPDSLGIPLMKAAKKRKCTIQAVILSILTEHFGVDAPVPKRGRPAKLE